MMGFNGFHTINIELSSRCNKSCWMCGRRKIDKDYPELTSNYGDMRFVLIKALAEQLPTGITVQFHNNGESLLHPRFGEAISLFERQTRCMNTNGKLLVKKAKQIINNLDSITISVIENDPDADEQYQIVKEFLHIKKKKKPFMVYRLLGDIKDRNRWEELISDNGGIIVDRILHNPMGSKDYVKPVTIPEIGICWDMLGHMAVDRFGKVSICVRFDPEGVGVIGDLNKDYLQSIWNGKKRTQWLRYHLMGKRYKVPLCSTCEFWGVPRG